MCRSVSEMCIYIFIKSFHMKYLLSCHGYRGVLEGKFDQHGTVGSRKFPGETGFKNGTLRKKRGLISKEVTGTMVTVRIVEPNQKYKSENNKY